MVILYIVVFDERPLLAACAGHMMKGGLWMVHTVSLHEKSLEATWCKNKKQRKHTDR